MAAKCAKTAIRIASASTKVQLCRRSSSALASSATEWSGLATSSSRFSVLKRPLSFSWLPEQLASVQMSLMPLHTVTASALFTSLLSLHNDKWGCLSEGFATPL